jgi:predicted nuclease of predicted toxin-antitoxin system
MRDFPIVADENIDFRLIKRLRESDFEVFSIAESSFGIMDTNVLIIATQRNSFLITEDKDFGDLAIRDNKPHNGILLIRRKRLTALEQIEVIMDILLNRSEELNKCFSVLRDGNLIIRRCEI